MTDKPMTIVDAINNGLRGEFTQIDMRNRAPTTNPLKRAHLALIGELAAMKVPSFSHDALAEEFDDTAEYVRKLAMAVDKALLAIGTEVRSNALCVVDLRYFDGMCLEVVDGWATNEIVAAGKIAEETRQDGDDEGDRHYDEARAQR